MRGFEIYERRSRESQKAMTLAISQLTNILLVSSMQGGNEKDELLRSVLRNADFVNQNISSDQNDVSSEENAENSDEHA
jgi:hypothetical protein